MTDPPKNFFLTTVLKRIEVGNSNLVTVNINLWSIKKIIFGSLRCLGLP